MAISESVYKFGNHFAFAVFWWTLGVISASLSPYFLDNDFRTVKEVGPIIAIVMVVLYAFGFFCREEEVMRTSIMKKQNGWIGNALFQIIAAVFTTAVGLMHDVSKDGVYFQSMLAVAVFAFMELAKPVLDFGMLQYFLRMPFQTAVALAYKHKAGWAVAIMPTFLLCFCTIWQSLYLYAFDAAATRIQPPARAAATATMVEQPRHSLPPQPPMTTRAPRRTPRGDVVLARPSRT